MCPVSPWLDGGMGTQPARRAGPRKSPGWAVLLLSCVFFLYLKNSKKYVHFEKFRKCPRSPGPGATGVLSPKQQATGPQCNFFWICKEVPSRGWGACRPLPPTGDRGSPTLYKSWPPFPSHLSPNIAPKIQKKREGWGEEKQRSSAELRTCDLPVTSVWIRWYCITI